MPDRTHQTWRVCEVDLDPASHCTHLHESLFSLTLPKGKHRHDQEARSPGPDIPPWQWLLCLSGKGAAERTVVHVHPFSRLASHPQGCLCLKWACLRLTGDTWMLWSTSGQGHLDGVIEVKSGPRLTSCHFFSKAKFKSLYLLETKYACRFDLKQWIRLHLSHPIKKHWASDNQLVASFLNILKTERSGGLWLWLWLLCRLHLLKLIPRPTCVTVLTCHHSNHYFKH